MPHLGSDMGYHPLQLTQLMLSGQRAPLTSSPTDVGLEYEDVAFEAADGVGLKGWFIPREEEGPGPVVLFVHGWLWNRAGNVAGHVPLEDRDVDFLPAVKALHDAGISVLLFDLRWHGESDKGKGPMTYGPSEASDLVGAVNYLRTRPEVDGERIGVIGTSMGGNISLYGAPECQPIKAILAIQPTRLAVFNHNFARTELGRFGPLIIKPIDLLYAARRAPRPSKHNPGIPARKLDNTLVKYVQGTGDQWGTMAVVEEFATVTPKVDGPVIQFPSEERYTGYLYISERVDEVVGFFSENL